MTFTRNHADYASETGNNNVIVQRNSATAPVTHIRDDTREGEVRITFDSDAGLEVGDAIEIEGHSHYAGHHRIVYKEDALQYTIKFPYFGQEAGGGSITITKGDKDLTGLTPVPDVVTRTHHDLKVYETRS